MQSSGLQHHTGVEAFIWRINLYPFLPSHASVARSGSFKAGLSHEHGDDFLWPTTSIQLLTVLADLDD